MECLFTIYEGRTIVFIPEIRMNRSWQGQVAVRLYMQKKEWRRDISGCQEQAGTSGEQAENRSWRVQ